MKQFEKWWSRFEPQIDPDTYDGNETEIRKAIGRCAHRAALKWIKDAGVITDGELAGRLIKEELNEY